MENFTVTFTRDELDMVWCEAIENMKYWRDRVFKYGNKDDKFMYDIAMSSYAKIHRLLPTAIIRSIKGFSKNKYKLTIRRGVK